MLQLVEANFEVPNVDSINRQVLAMPHFQELAWLEPGFKGPAIGWTGSILPSVELQLDKESVATIRINSIYDGVAFGMARAGFWQSKKMKSLLPASCEVHPDMSYPFRIPDVSVLPDDNPAILPGVQILFLENLSSKKDVQRFATLTAAVRRSMTTDPGKLFNKAVERTNR